jgi:hypothetical protein
MELNDEIWEYNVIMSITGGVMGSEMYNRVEEIITNNPMWFPWEHKYRSIPSHVHQAYKKESGQSWHLDPNADPIKPSKGLIPTLMEMKSNVIEYKIDKDKTLQESLSEVFKSLEDQRKEQEKRTKEQKAIWDKHYKKYKLQYRP